MAAGELFSETANFRKVDPKMAKKEFSTYEKIIILLEKNTSYRFSGAIPT